MRASAAAAEESLACAKYRQKGTRKVQHTGKNESRALWGGGSGRGLAVRHEKQLPVTSGLGNPSLLPGTGWSAVSVAPQPGVLSI